MVASSSTISAASANPSRRIRRSRRGDGWMVASAGGVWLTRRMLRPAGKYPREPDDCAYLPGAHLRVPDERPRLRAAVRAAGGRGVRPRGRGCYPGRGGVQYLRGTGERGQPAVREPRPPAPGEAVPSGDADRGGRLPGAEGPRRDRGAGTVGGRGVR